MHETHHVLQAVAEAYDAKGLKDTPAQRYRDQVDGLFDTIGEQGRLNYVSNFLYASEIDGSEAVRLNVAVLLSRVPSFALKVNESAPVTLKFGV